MGGCASIKQTVRVTFGTEKRIFECKNLPELRLQIIKSFSITSSFILSSRQQIIKSLSDLLYTPHPKGKFIEVSVILCPEELKLSKCQVKLRKGFGVIIMGKYLIFPEDCFTEHDIKNQSICIGNEFYELKNFYHKLEIPGLALAKITRSGRCLENLVIPDDSSGNLFIFKDYKKCPAGSIKDAKHLTGSLVYNEKNIPVAILAWSNENLIVPLSQVQNAIMVIDNMHNLPTESIPLNTTHMNTSMSLMIYTEHSCLASKTNLITFHPNDYSVSYSELSRDLRSFSATQSPIGFIFSYDLEVLSFDTQSLSNLPKPSSSHKNHSALVHQINYIVFSGTLNPMVESLHLYNMTWTLMPSLPYSIENPATCSLGAALYVLGGRSNGEATDTVMKLEEKSSEWEILKWKLPWTTVGCAAFSIGREIVVFGGQQNDKDKFTVLENGREVAEGYLGTHGSFEGVQAGRVNLNFVIQSKQGQFFKYDSQLKRFFVCSIGNYVRDKSDYE